MATIARLVVYYDPGSNRIESEDGWDDDESAQARVDWLNKNGATAEFFKIQATAVASRQTWRLRQRS